VQCSFKVNDHQRSAYRFTQFQSNCTISKIDQEEVMVTNIYPCNTGSSDLSSEAVWVELYPKLLSLSRRFVYMHRLPCWSGQEEDIADDVAQETAHRLIERSQQAIRGVATPIASIENMMAKIALNFVRDLRRHDRRVIRILPDDGSNKVNIDVNALMSMSEVATENVYHEWLFQVLAHEIAKFPYKQRRAVLMDLANRMSFGRQSTALQMAFSAVGIDLQEYQQPLPENSVERARHSALLYYAYRRLAQLNFLRREIYVA
jgi:DNA-directed RNA polymerase specialized sigma24 family protein